MRGKGSRKIKKIICLSCKEDREKNKSVAARDAFGRRVTQRNSEAQSRFLTNKNNNKVDTDGETF